MKRSICLMVLCLMGNGFAVADKLDTIKTYKTPSDIERELQVHLQHFVPGLNPLTKLLNPKTPALKVNDPKIELILFTDFDEVVNIVAEKGSKAATIVMLPINESATLNVTTYQDGSKVFLFRSKSSNRETDKEHDLLLQLGKDGNLQILVARTTTIQDGKREYSLIAH